MIALEFLGCVGPVGDITFPDHPTDLSTSFRNSIAVIIDPPRQEIGEPAWFWVAGRAHVGADPACRTVAAEHVKEHLFGERLQLVELDQDDLRTAPVLK